MTGPAGRASAAARCSAPPTRSTDGRPRSAGAARASREPPPGARTARRAQVRSLRPPAATLLPLLPQLRQDPGVARSCPLHRGGMLPLRLGGVGQVFVLSVVPRGYLRRGIVQRG